MTQNPNTSSKPDATGGIRSSAWLGAFVARQENRSERPTPSDALDSAVKRLESVAYTRGLEDALSRMEMLSAIVPESVTKARLLEMLRKEIGGCIARWERDVKAPNDKVSGPPPVTPESKQSATGGFAAPIG